MAHVPASSHGSTFAGGTISPTTDPGLAVSVPDATNDAIAVLASDHGGSLVFGVDAFGNVSGGQFNISPNSAINALVVSGFDAIHYLAAFAPSAGAQRVLIGPHGYLIIKAQTAPADAELSASQLAFWADDTNGAAALGHKAKTADGTVVTSKYPLRQSAGALATVAPVSATAFQCSTTQDVVLVVAVTYNPGVATTATCKVELSPDNVTFSTLLTVTQPVGTVFDGSIEPLTLLVPAAWYVKLTVVNATLGTGTYY